MVGEPAPMSKQREHGCFPAARGRSLTAGPRAKSLAATVRCVLVAAILLSVPSACADDGLVPGKVYVAPDGNATNAGTRQAPLRTIARGAERCQPGDVVHVLPGRYAKATVLEPAVRGRAARNFFPAFLGKLNVAGPHARDVGPRCPKDDCRGHSIATVPRPNNITRPTCRPIGSSANIQRSTTHSTV